MRLVRFAPVGFSRSFRGVSAWTVLAIFGATPLGAVPLKLSGATTYQLQADGASVSIATTLTNQGATASGTLQLQLWAFALPYNPTAPVAGYKLATVNLTALPAGASYPNLVQVAAYSPPASGTWSIALFAEENPDGGAFVIRDFFNFPDQLAVAGSLAIYSPGKLLGVTTPATLQNLLIDPSHLYWTHVESGSIDTVGLTAGSQPAVLANFAAGLANRLALAQDSLNLYALHQTLLGNGDIFKVSKTSGASTLLAASDNADNGPRESALGIHPNGGTLYFPAFQNLPFDIGFIGCYASQMSTSGGAITHYGTTPPVDERAEPANVSAVSYAADYSNIHWIDSWDHAIHSMPLVGGLNIIEVPNLSIAASFLKAPTEGPAGGSLFWIDGSHPNRALKRRKVGGQIITVIGDVASDSYAIDGDHVYLVSGVVGQANQQMCSVPIDGGTPRALLSILDTGVTGEIVADGNAIYWISIDVSLNTRIKKLGLPVTGAPAIAQQPQSQHVAPGATVQFTALAGGGGLSQVWYRNGVALVAATGGSAPDAQPRSASVVQSSANTSTLTLSNVSAADMGFYSCAITNSLGTTQTAVAILTIDTGGPSRLINVSTRGQVQAGAALTPGFVMRGTGSKQLLIRAVGPTLSVFGLAALSDTKMDVFNQQTNALALTNDDWGGGTALTNTFSSLGAFALAANSKDAAAFTSLPVNQGGYTVRITASGSATSGLALAEVYDADALSSPAKLANVSTLGFAGVGADALTPGFVIGGTAPKQLLIRAIGPGLAAFGVGGTLADPRFSLIPLGTSLTIASNDDWGGTAELKAAFAAAGAFSVPDNTKDAALVVRLPPGGYSVVVSGANNTSGNVLVEVYDLDP